MPSNFVPCCPLQELLSDPMHPIRIRDLSADTFLDMAYDIKYVVSPCTTATPYMIPHYTDTLIYVECLTYLRPPLQDGLMRFKPRTYFGPTVYKHNPATNTWAIVCVDFKSTYLSSESHDIWVGQGQFGEQLNHPTLSLRALQVC